MIKIPKSVTLHDVEELYAQLDSDNGQEITLPTDLHCAQLGTVGALIQFIITWSKHYAEGKLLIHTTSPQLINRYLENLAHTHHGLIAMLLSDDILTANRQRSVLPQAFSIYDAALRDIGAEKYAPLSGPEILLVCADHTEHAFIQQLYSHTSAINDPVKGQKEFSDVVENLIEDLSTRYQQSFPPDDELKQNLATILYELFKNTHQWARHELNGQELSRSVRGIRLEFTPLIQMNFKQQPARTQDYAKAVQEERGVVDFLEISLFDSGPGLAARGLRRIIDDATTVDEEYKGIVTCLKKYSSSSDKEHRGIGLLEVMRTLTKASALLRIRTGRLALFRNFISDPLHDDEDLWLYDWFTESDTLNRAFPVEGLLVSALLPIKTARRK